MALDLAFVSSMGTASIFAPRRLDGYQILTATSRQHSLQRWGERNSTKPTSWPPAGALIAERGPQAVTVDSVAERLKAPKGSFYYRFASRDALLGEVWLTTVLAYQEGFVAAIDKGDGLRRAPHASLGAPAFGRRAAPHAL